METAGIPEDGTAYEPRKTRAMAAIASTPAVRGHVPRALAAQGLGRGVECERGGHDDGGGLAITLPPQ